MNMFINLRNSFVFLSSIWLVTSSLKIEKNCLREENERLASHFEHKLERQEKTIESMQTKLAYIESEVNTVKCDQRLERQDEIINTMQKRIELLVSKLGVNTLDVVAFSAHQSDDTNFGNGATIQFPSEITNFGGHYDIYTSRFSCPVHGLYLFTSTIYTDDDKGSEAVIVQNGYWAASLVANQQDNDQNSNVVILECIEGDIIEVLCTRGDGCQLRGHPNSNTFSGMLMSLIV